MAGRLSKEEKLKEPQFTDVADKWITYIGTIYEEYRMKYFNMAQDLKYEVNEDLLNDTIICCYNSISRNGLSDQSEQGMRNYLFRAFKMNLNIVPNYNKRKYNSEDLNVIYERYEESGEPTYKKTKEQLLQDYSIIYILDKIESNFDTVSFHCYRLKNLVPCTYEKLRTMTNVKDCKKRVVKINKWLKENITRQEIYESFIKDFPDFE